MLKRLLLSVAMLSSVTTGYASRPSNEALEQSDEYRLYKSNPVEYYKTHPASKNETVQTLGALGNDLLSYISAFLTPEELNKLYSVNREMRNLKVAALVKTIPGMYCDLGLDRQAVFPVIDNPRWQPEQGLPDMVRFQLHYWFWKAKRLQSVLGSVVAEAPDDTAAAQIKRIYRLFYQAGCLGHMLAGQEAGQMLLEPLYNSVVPLVMPYEDMDPDVKAWDIKRLNQPIPDPLCYEIFCTLDSHSSFHEDDREVRRLAVARLAQVRDATHRRIVETYAENFEACLRDHENENLGDAERDDNALERDLKLINDIELVGGQSDLTLLVIKAILHAAVHASLHGDRDNMTELFDKNFEQMSSLVSRLDAGCLNSEVLSLVAQLHLKGVGVFPDHAPFTNERIPSLVKHVNSVFVQDLLGCARGLGNRAICFTPVLLSEYSLRSSPGNPSQLTEEEGTVLRAKAKAQAAYQLFLAHLAHTRSPKFDWHISDMDNMKGLHSLFLDGSMGEWNNYDRYRLLLELGEKKKPMNDRGSSQ